MEFLPPGSFEPVSGYRGGGATGWRPENGPTIRAWPWPWPTASPSGLGPPRSGQAIRRVVEDWRVFGERRAFDIGVTTAAALRRFAATRDARMSGDDTPQASGNGSIIRLAPVPVACMNLFPGSNDQLVQRLMEPSVTIARELAVCVGMRLHGSGAVRAPSWSAP